jgi:putative DNA methylase
MGERFLIERALPIKALSQEARREKAIRHGHISTLHVWWARRPLVVARAAVLGALLTEDAEVDEKFIANLCKWEVHDGDPVGRYLLEQARTLIRKRFGNEPPKVLDSFAGGGSIPLEALRLGCEAYALEYNPVAYIILKATIEFPQRFRQGIRDEGRGTKEEMHHEHSVISGLGNLEKGDGIGCSSVSPDQALPSGRNARSDQPNAPSSSFHTHKHCGRMGTREQEGIHPISADCQRFTSGTGDPSGYLQKPSLPEPRGYADNAGSGGGNQPHAQWVDCEPEERDEKREMRNEAVPSSLNPKPSSITDAVRFWGNWVLEQARKELSPFYPSVVPHPSPLNPHPSPETPIAYIWSRTIRCPNPSCGAEIPLFRQFWLARKGTRKEIALAPVVDRDRRCVNFRIVQRQGDSWQVIDDSPSNPRPSPLIPNSFDPSKGTVSRGNAVCLVCGTSVKDDYVKAEAQAGRMGHRLVAVVTTKGKGQGRNYRLATEEDMEAFRKAEKALQNLLQTPSPWAFGLSWVPEESVPTHDTRAFFVHLYGQTRWCDLFNPRQLLSLCTFGKWVREAYRQILRESGDDEFAKAVATYLALAFDKLAELASVLTPWEPDVQCARHVFARHAITMVWDYAETNPLANSSGGWINTVFKMLEGLRLSVTKAREPSVYHGSATALPFPDKHFDAVIIDPPYADNVPYADLSDFFYVWLRRTVGDLYPEAFRWALTPKDEEAVVNPARFGGGKKGEQIAQAHYQRLMQKSFEEIYRVLKPEGMAVVMFTHRSTEAWERLIQSLLDAGLYPTASFPVHTEMESSTHQRGKGAIRSTILMACRRRPENAPIGWYAQVRAEMEQVIPQRLKEFWDAGIRGADFFISAIGPSVGVFGRFRKVMRPDGREVSVGELLDEVRTIVTSFALERLGLSRLDEPTRFYVLYRWAYGGDELEFDEANKLAKSVGAELDRLQEQQRLIKRDGSVVTLLTFTERWQEKTCQGRWMHALENGTVAQLPEIDQLHIALGFWRRGETEMLAGFLRQAGIQDETHPFWQTAQAILEVEGLGTRSEGLGKGENLLPSNLREEVKALEQLLASKRNLLRQAASFAESEQPTLFQG